MKKQTRPIASQIRDEVTLQLRELKEHLLKEMDKKIQAAVAQATGQVRDKVQALEKKQVAAENAAAEANQLAVVETKEIARQASGAVYSKVMREINTKLVPELDRMAQWLNYQTQDTDGVVEQYRREVETPIRGDVKLLTNGGDLRHIITPQVRLLFEYGDGQIGD